MSPRRQLSEFLCREMLYDFATDSLDQSRKQAVESSLKEYPELEDELRALNNGIEYLSVLGEVEVSEPLYAEIDSERGLYSTIITGGTWPRWLKWSIEALVLAIAVAAVVRFVPLDLFSQSPEDWTVTSVESDSTPAEIEVKAPEKESVPVPAAVAETVDKPTEVKVKSLDNSKPVAAAAVGYVYRMYLFSDKVDEITPHIVAKIKEFGGEKAGEVQLGWRKPRGSYFHFTLPKEKNGDLSNFIRKYGDLTISKDEHRRVMPPGTHRLILWIEEVSPTLRKSNEREENTQ